MFPGSTESLNYAGNDGTCDHSWLTMRLGNAPLVSSHHSLKKKCKKKVGVVHCRAKGEEGRQKTHTASVKTVILYDNPTIIFFNDVVSFVKFILNII